MEKRRINTIKMKEEITKIGSSSDKLVTEIQDTASKLMSINSEKELEIRSGTAIFMFVS